MKVIQLSHLNHQIVISKEIDEIQPIEENITTIQLTNELIEDIQLDMNPVISLPTQDESILSVLETTGNPDGPYTRFNIDISQINIDPVKNSIVSTSCCCSTEVINGTKFYFKNCRTSSYGQTFSVAHKTCYLIFRSHSTNMYIVKAFVNSDSNNISLSISSGSYYSSITYGSKSTPANFLLNEIADQYYPDIVFLDFSSSDSYITNIYLNKNEYSIDLFEN